MLQPARELTPYERHFLRQQGYNPKHFIRIEKDWESYTFVEVMTGKILILRR